MRSSPARAGRAGPVDVPSPRYLLTGLTRQQLDGVIRDLARAGLPPATA